MYFTHRQPRGLSVLDVRTLAWHARAIDASFLPLPPRSSALAASRSSHARGIGVGPGPLTRDRRIVPGVFVRGTVLCMAQRLIETCCFADIGTPVRLAFEGPPWVRLGGHAVMTEPLDPELQAKKSRMAAAMARALALEETSASATSQAPSHAATRDPRFWWDGTQGKTTPTSAPTAGALPAVDIAVSPAGRGSDSEPARGTGWNTYKPGLLALFGTISGLLLVIIVISWIPPAELEGVPPETQAGPMVPGLLGVFFFIMAGRQFYLRGQSMKPR